MNFRLIISVILTLIFIIDIKTVSIGVLNAMRFCADSLVPSLLIFFVMSDLITKAVLTAKNNKISPKWTAFCLGSACGFPIGASICETFVQSGILDKKSADRILPFCNNTSPAFVLGAIGVSLLHNRKIGLLLYVAEILSAFILVLTVKCKVSPCVTYIEKTNLLKEFQDSIEKAIGTTLKMCGFVCFFSAVLSFFSNFLGGKLYTLAALSLEIGNGVYVCSGIFESNEMLSIALLGFVCGWSGFCVHLQIVSAAKSIKVNFLRLIANKFVQGLLTAILAMCGYKLFFTLEI